MLKRLAPHRPDPFPLKGAPKTRTYHGAAYWMPRNVMRPGVIADRSLLGGTQTLKHALEPICQIKYMRLHELGLTMPCH